MNDIIIYNELRTKVIQRVQNMYYDNRSMLIIGCKDPGEKERLQKEQAYLEYIVSTLVALPMPD